MSMDAIAERLLSIARIIRNDIAEMTAKGLKLAEDMPGGDDTSKIYFDLQFFALYLICADGKGSQDELELFNLTFGTRLTEERLATEMAVREAQIAAYGDRPSHLLRAAFMVDAATQRSQFGDRMIDSFGKFGEILALETGNDPKARERLENYLRSAATWRERTTAHMKEDSAPTTKPAGGKPVFGKKTS